MQIGNYSVYVIPAPRAQNCEPIQIETIGDSFVLELDPDSALVFLNPKRYTVEAACITILKPGLYGLQAGVIYSVDQWNESFFIEFRDTENNLALQLEPNAGSHKIVADTSGDPSQTSRDAGKFYLEQGTYIIVLNHYYLIHQQYPDFLNPPDEPLDGQNAESWHINYLAAGEEFIARFTATLPADLPDSLLSLTNVACVSAPNDTNTTDNDDETKVIVTEGIIEDCEHSYYFDKNLFVPDNGHPLNIYFKLKSSQTIRLDLYDISGYHISTLAEDEYNAGLNKYQWDGRADKAQHIGSGAYIIALRTQHLNCWKKVILVR